MGTIAAQPGWPAFAKAFHIPAMATAMNAMYRMTTIAMMSFSR
jgi:hypothetical protein